MFVNAEIIAGKPSCSLVGRLGLGPRSSACHHDRSAGLLDLLSGGRADAIDLEVELLADFSATEDLNSAERAAHEPGAAEKFFVDSGAIVETLFQIIQVNDPVNGLERGVVESAFG